MTNHSLMKVEDECFKVLQGHTNGYGLSFSIWMVKSAVAMTELYDFGMLRVVECGEVFCGHTPQYG